MEKLRDTFRKACPPGHWSQGVTLARAGAVVGVSADDEEVVCKVRARGMAHTPTVTLYPEDEEWDCDCNSRLETCSHVAAAIVSVMQANKAGDALPTSSQKAARVVYDLTTSKRGLKVVRRLRVDGETEDRPFPLSLPQAISNTPAGAQLEVNQQDREIERLLNGQTRELSVRMTPVVLDALADLPSEAILLLNGKTIEVSRKRMRPHARVFDQKDKVILSVEAPPELDEVVAAGVCRAGSVLHPIGESDVGGLAFEKLPQRSSYAKPQWGQLVTAVLPELKRKISVQVQSKRLPSPASRMKPRLQLELWHEGSNLSVLPTLVYGDPPQARIDGGKLVQLGKRVPVRQTELERKLLGRLRDELNLVPGRRVLFEGRDAAAFSKKLQNFSGEIDQRSDKGTFAQAPLVPKLEFVGDSPRLSFHHPDRESDGQPGPFAAAGKAVLEAWRAGLPIVPVEGGGFAHIPNDWLGEFGDSLFDMIGSQKENGEVARAHLPALAAICQKLNVPAPAELTALRTALEDFAGIPQAALPNPLHAELRQYQQVGVNWLGFLKSVRIGALLADDMGLGKTLQTLCVLEAPALIVCPRSVVHNWCEEIAKFRPNLTVNQYAGSKRSLDGDWDITIMSYGVLRLDIEKVAAKRFKVAALDEAQAIKNPTSQVSQAAYRINADFRISLSGTPIENRLDELWSQFHFTNPGYLGGRRRFQSRYEKLIAGGSDNAAAQLRKKIAPFFLRRLKSEVATELPPRTDSLLLCELDEAEQRAYNGIVAGVKAQVQTTIDGGGSVMRALEALLRLRQAACHRGLLPGHEAESSSKLQRLLGALQTATLGGHKSLVFSQWTGLLDKTEPLLKAEGIEYLRLDGSTRDRAQVVRDFQSESGPPVLLISLKAGGTGLNLTAADHVFMLDPWWNPAVEDQAADRAHRIGQDKPVVVYKLVAQGTVEEGIVRLQEKKRALAAAALGGGDAALGLSKQELMDLLQEA